MLKSEAGRFWAVLISAVAMLACTAGAQAVSIDWTTVGDASNRWELAGTGAGGFGANRLCGAVSYTYKISKYEITNGQYRDFLNAVAQTDTNGLWSSDMASTRGGIARTGTPGSYSYSAKDGDPNWDSRPVNFVSFWNACRFVNWIANDQPVGAQGPSTTEGGAYTLTLAGMNNNTIQRNQYAKVAIASEDEWYKAAYSKGGSTNADYCDYALSSDTTPDNNAPGSDSGNSTNYKKNGAFAVGSPYFSTVAGAYSGHSAYGTYDQNGNVAEWNDSIPVNMTRGVRGGSWGSDEDPMAAAYRNFSSPSFGYADIGFRIVEIPEPVTLCLLGMGGLAMLARRRGK